MVQANGYIVYTSEAIFGTGLTVRDALLDSRKWLDPDCDPESAPDVKIAPATDALLDEVAKRGGAIAWGKIGNVCCTLDEEDRVARGL